MKWLFSLLGIHRNSAEDDARLEQYQAFRELGRHYNLGLIKRLPPSALPECSKKLGLSKAGTLILNQDDEIAVLYDYCLHHHRRAGKNIIERTLGDQTAPAVGSPERVYLEAMNHAFFSVFQIVEILPQKGARLTDLLTHRTLDIMDLGLSSAGIPGVIVAGRLLTIDTFTMSSGTLVPLPEFIIDQRIQPVISKFTVGKSLAQGQRLSPGQSAAFESQILRIALNMSGEDNSFYTDIDV